MAKGGRGGNIATPLEVGDARDKAGEMFHVSGRMVSGTAAIF